MQHILGQSSDKKSSTNNEKKKEERLGRQWTFQRKDPNAMDIDAMTTEQRDEVMKKYFTLPHLFCTESERSPSSPSGL